MKPNPCTICGEPGIPGLISGCGKCQYHYNVGQFGQEWADKVERNMNTTPLYIFDLDGTLALIDHRRHFLDDQADPKRWQKFFAACVDDQPNEPVRRKA